MNDIISFKKLVLGHLGGSVGWASDFSSGHDLTAREFEPHVGLCANNSEPGACFRFCVSLSLCPSPAHALSLSVSKIKKQKTKTIGKVAKFKNLLFTELITMCGKSKCSKILVSFTVSLLIILTESMASLELYP